MTGKQGLGLAAAVAVAAGGGYILYRETTGHPITVPMPGILTTPGIHGGIKVTLPSGWPTTDRSLGTQVAGTSPGSRGENLFPQLWSVAPKTVPSFVPCKKGTGWVTIAVGLEVLGDYNGRPANSQGPWVGTAEYTDGQLVRVFPGPAYGGPSNMSALGSYAGFYC